MGSYVRIILTSDALLKLKNGDHTLFNSYYYYCRNTFISYMHPFGCSSNDAKDIYQDVIMKFYEDVKCGTITELRCCLQTYLFDCGYAQWCNQKKHENICNKVHDDLKHKLQHYCLNEAESNYNTEYIISTLNKYLGTLDTDDRKIIEYSDIDELDWETISGLFNNKKAGTLTKRKHDLMIKLKKKAKGEKWDD
jgi:DNA-directed RNA polymerase specialized sigma24 family protein